MTAKVIVEDTPWKQITITYPGHSRQEREQHALTHLSQALPTAEDAGLITAWWFIRKGPWRLRYLPTDEEEARRRLTQNVTWTTDIYEPETHAFGGPDAMHVAHDLFHHDSRHLLTYLQQHPTDRRERSLILCTALMRAAGLDLTEQGDVWARVHHHRATHPTQPPDAHTWNRFTHQVRHLITGQLRTTNDWHTTFTTAGTDLQHLRATGRLTRGIRTVIALHVIFHWNRIGIPAATQATLAHAGKSAIFDVHGRGAS
ncbi:thiopeptide-type bacteriocin biosynthesis protein [Salinispora arenicola]|uniref:thiopeptide-type bacteriocin biosynthesis protein n=1 Tax=Salinispora arenicola TaxID=168697 RepID=UPI00036E3ED3